MNNTLYLQKLANKHGDFRIAIAQKTPQGMRWSKHYTVLQCWEMGQKGQWILQHANNRQILPNEMIADLDAENATLTNMNNLCNYLEQNQIHYTAYFTGSKGYHIHTLNKTELTKKTKEYFLNRFKCDMAKANATALIALEGSPHWKTGALKTEIRHYGMTTQRIHRPEEND